MSRKDELLNELQKLENKERETDIKKARQEHFKKFHKEITGPSTPIYSVDITSALLETGKYGYRKLSQMKQDNIRFALLSHEFLLEDIKTIFRAQCGFCFKFFCRVTDCRSCPIHKKLKRDCIDLPEYNRMVASESKEEFLKLHRSWCKKISLEVKE